ncbi:MAG: HAMP domain-containing sensor histidine kinase [Pirellulaceae bacterium]|nr:HAMP domain-containing sensor histidine kinase [Pirellulaceae bacterium]
MFERRSLRWPITLGVVMIVLVVLLIVGWVVLAAFGLVADYERATFYITLLSLGATFLTLVLVGVVMYLTLTIKAINLSRRQTNFIDSVTHELKSPIASLKLYLQTLNRRPVSPEEQADFYRYMLEDVERLDSLINHLLDAARLEKDRTPPELVDVELAGVLRGVAETVCQRQQVPLEIVTLELTPCIVRAAPVDLELIFRNLIDNAVKYASDENPQVEIVLLAESDGQVRVRVSDNGPGIPAKYRRKLFGRFMRLGSELERAKPGTGLGLYIVRTLVKRLGGTIRIESRDRGTGTTFEVSLPGKQGTAKAAPQPDAA